MQPDRQISVCGLNRNSSDSSDFHHHQRPVVKQRGALGKPIDFVQNSVGEFRGREPMVLFNQLLEPADTEELTLAIGGFGDAVRMKHQNVSRFKRDTPFVVAYIFINSQWKTG